MESILQAFSDIADVLPRLDRLKATFPEDTNFNQAVGLIYSDLIEFHQRVYKFFRRKAWHIWFAFDWGLFERRFKQILQKLAYHCNLLEKEATAAHFSEMKQFRDKNQLEVDTFERQRSNQMVGEVFSWLSAAEDEQESHLNRNSDKRQIEICNWVLKDPQMRPWIENDSGDAVLWMTGIPGAGKSLLCSKLVQNLQTQQHFSTLYYFCGHQSSSGDTSATILRTLTIQLLQQNLDMATLVHQAYLSKGSNRSGPAMKKLLIQVLPTSKVARIVIDGIDEGDHATQQEILKSLIDIQKNANNYCKMLVSSRDEPQIQKSLAAKIHVKLGEKTAEDLSLYIKDRIESLRAKFRGIDPALVRLAEQRLHNKAKGMFLWVRLVTDTLINQTSELEIEQAIDQLPEGLDEAYGVIKSRINCLRPVQLRQRAFNILYWVCVARRPISLHEVADGIVLHPGQRTLNKRSRINNFKQDIIERCAPLLERLNDGVLDLVHFSAKEYFLHEQSGPFIELAKAHLSIALSCVINLTSCLDLVPRNTDRISEEDLESCVVQGRYGLQSYGQEFWAEHVLAYLEEAAGRDTDTRELIGVLEAFSQVWKHRVHADHADISLPPTPDKVEASLGLKYLRTFPILHSFISGWLRFRSEYSKMTPSFSSLDAQEQWRLGNDETFLSLIDSRLCTITERLLMMQSSRLPPHIHEDDFNVFVSPFRFPCRFQGCNYQYRTVQERDAHEVSHVLTFPCLQCDFSGRGFRSRRDLERHTQKYHMSPEDFEVPDDLQIPRGNARGDPTLTSGAFRVPCMGRWTERGRKALNQGFHDVLARLESEMEKAAGNAVERGPNSNASTKVVGPTLSQHAIETTKITSLDYIRHNVQEQRYESLAQFKNDLNVVCRHSSTDSESLEYGRIESICDDEFENAMSAFPAFANFDHTASKKREMAALSSHSTEPLQVRGEGLDGPGYAKAQAIPFGSRVPYWSQPEEKQFPELLHRCGRNFSKIADHLKTKTPKDVDLHFTHLLNMGNNELLDLADLADARLQEEADTIEITIGSKDVESEMQTPNNLAREDSSEILRPSQVPSAGTYFPQIGNFKTLQPPKRLNMDSGDNIDGPKSKKRRPRPREQCPHCPFLKDGLRDEYALKRHTERFHAPTRKVWICEDISIDKKWLANCKSCSASKRYSSAHYADKHLRKKHFNASTSGATLQRWMRETEEPNSRMLSPLAGSASPTRPTTKEHKARRTALSLPPLKNHLDSLRTLPSMSLETGLGKHSNSVSSPRSSSSLDGNLEDDDDDNESDARDASLSSPEAKSFKKDVFLEGISFDNLLPCNTNEPRSLNSDGPPHLVNRALIRPDQVPRLPNLDSFRKAACLDQVEALYHRLENAPKYSSQYKESLERLTSLSRLLMTNLRDWQRHSTLAPNIPFSI